MGVDDAVGLGERAVATLLGGEIDDDGPGSELVDDALGHEHGRLLAGHERRRDDHVHLGRLRFEELHLGLDELLAHHLRVAALALAALLEGDLEEGAAQALDLLLGGGTRVEGAHLGAQGARGGDGGEASDARADDEHLGGRRDARGRDLGPEEVAEVGGGLDDGAVARQVRHGAEHVHLLGARDAGDAVEGEGVDLLFGEGVDDGLVARRMDERDEQEPLVGQIDLGLARRPHLHDDVGLGPHGLRVVGERCARGLVGGVIGVGAQTGAALHEHIEPESAQLAHRFGHGGDAPLARVGLGGDSDANSSTLGGREHTATSPERGGFVRPNCRDGALRAASVSCTACHGRTAGREVAS